MGKDLEKEYLEDLDHYDEGMGIHSTSYEKCKERLIRLAKIDNSNPSEALECLEEIIHEFNEPHIELSGEYSYKNELLRRCENEVNSIKQALIKAQEQENIFGIIKKYLFNEDDEPSQEETDLLKRYFK